MEDIKYGPWLWTVTPLNYYLARNPNNIAIYKPKETEEDKMEELKPCPFCGSEAILRKVETGRNRSGYEYYIRCGNINCPVYVTTCNRDTEDEAVEIWNRRAE